MGYHYPPGQVSKERFLLGITPSQLTTMIAVISHVRVYGMGPTRDDVRDCG